MHNDVKTLCDADGRGDLATLVQILDQEPALILLDRVADPNVRDEEFGSPPSGWANEKGHASTVRLLRGRGARISACQAVIWGRTSIVARLLELGADAGRGNRDGRSALELALAQAGNGRAHTPIVIEERRLEIERECAYIATMVG